LSANINYFSQELNTIIFAFSFSGLYLSRLHASLLVAIFKVNVTLDFSLSVLPERYL